MHTCCTSHPHARHHDMHTRLAWHTLQQTNAPAQCGMPTMLFSVDCCCCCCCKKKLQTTREAKNTAQHCSAFVDEIFRCRCVHAVAVWYTLNVENRAEEFIWVNVCVCSLYGGRNRMVHHPLFWIIRPVTVCSRHQRMRNCVPPPEHTHISGCSRCVVYRYPAARTKSIHTHTKYVCGVRCGSSMCRVVLHLWRTMLQRSIVHSSASSCAVRTDLSDYVVTIWCAHCAPNALVIDPQCDVADV